jgi:hypothetical protein
VSRLTDSERGDLAGLAAEMQAMRPDLLAVQRHAARGFADLLRLELPDVDDVTLGRVLLQVGMYLGRAAASEEMSDASDLLVISAIDMTSLERDASGGGS